MTCRGQGSGGRLAIVQLDDGEAVLAERAVDARAAPIVLTRLAGAARERATIAAAAVENDLRIG